MSFKPPRRVSTIDKNGKTSFRGPPIEAEDEMDTSSSDESSSLDATQQYTPEVEKDDGQEKVFRQECLDWLALNGKALLALEVSKFLAKERKNSTKQRTATLSKSGLLV